MPYSRIINLYDKGQEAVGLWLEAETHYMYAYRNAESARQLDEEISSYTYNDFVEMPVELFLEFYINKLYPWKYRRDRYNRVNKVREYYNNSAHLEELANFFERLKNTSQTDEELIITAKKIYGLGVPGGTALLAIMYPERFGVVDKFVALELKCNSHQCAECFAGLNAENISVKEAVKICELLRTKAQELGEGWTPRRIDKALWANRERI